MDFERCSKHEAIIEELIAALRQCDGAIQSISHLFVRADPHLIE